MEVAREQIRNPVSIELRKGQEPNYQGKGHALLVYAGGLQSRVIWPMTVIWPKPKSDFGAGVKDAPVV